MHSFTLENGDECILSSGQALPANLKETTMLSIPGRHYVPGLQNQHVFISGTYGTWKQNLLFLQDESTSECEVLHYGVLRSILAFLPNMEHVYESKESDPMSKREWQNFMEDCSILICLEKKKGRDIVVMPGLDFDNEDNIRSAYFWW